MYERSTVYSGEQPQSSKFMQFERDAAKSLAQFILDAMGSQGPWYTGLAAAPGTGLEVTIGQGAVYQYGQIDPTAWSTLPADTWEGELLGIVLSSQTLSGFTAPTTSGQSIDYLIECQIQVTDSAAVSTPYYSSANQPPTYEMSSPFRQNLVVFQVKAGTAATTGTQTPPSVDSGWVPLYVVTVDYGETSLTSADIVQASGAPLFSGFVHTNPNGNTPVYLSPTSQQTGTINISGTAQVDTIQATDSLLGGASATTNFDGTWANGFAGDYLSLTAVGFTGSSQTTDSLNIKGSIGYTGTHAGTDADPYPISQLNVTMLGGKLASDYALASGHYLTLYSGTPTADATNVNAAIDGYFLINVAQGTAPISVVSTTMCPNLNAQYISGYAPGNASGNVPISNGTLCTNLNAQLLNGLQSSAFQLAGSYAEMNVVNTGSFECSNGLSTTGNTGSTQSVLTYAATNGYGINSGGPATLVESVNSPLGLVGSSTQTSGPLYVGGGSPKSAYAQDIIPSGIVRSGMCVYTVTQSPYTSYPYPGNGNHWGTFGSPTGQINVGADTVDGAQFWIGFRCKVTFNANLGVSFNGLGYAYGTVYVDGSVVGTVGGLANGCSHTFTAGTHTIDIVYTSQNINQPYYLGSEGTTNPYGGNFVMFGWIPMSNGQISSAITSIIPG